MSIYCTPNETRTRARDYACGKRDAIRDMRFLYSAHVRNSEVLTSDERRLLALEICAAYKLAFGFDFDFQTAFTFNLYTPGKDKD